MAENWWDAAPRVDRPSKGGQWWEAAPTLDETLPAAPDFGNVRSGSSSVPVAPGDPEPVGFWRAMLERARAGMMSTVGGGVQALGESLARPYRPLRQTALAPLAEQLGQPYESLAATGAEIVGDADIYRQIGMQGVTAPGSLGDVLADPGNAARYWGGIIAESTPTMLAAMATRNPSAAAAVTGAGAGAQQYGGARAEGRTHEEAMREAQQNALIEGALSTLPFEAALSGASLPRRLATVPLLEGTTESVAEGGQTLATAATRGESVSQDELGRAMLDAFVAGAGMGVGEAVLGRGPSGQPQAAPPAAPQPAAQPAAPPAPLGDALAPAPRPEPEAPRAAPPRPRQEAPPPDDIDTLLLRNIPQEEAPVAPEPARAAPMPADAAPEAPSAAEAAARLSEVEGAGIRAESAPEVQDTLPPDATFEEFAQWTAARAQADLPQQIEQMREALPRYERDAALAAEQAALRPNDPTAQQFALEEEAALEYLRARLEDAENGRVPEAEPEMLRGAYEMWRERQQPEVTQVAPDAMPDATSAAAMRSPDAPQEQGGLPSEGVGDVRPLPASRPDSRVDDTPPAPLDIRYGKPRTPPGRNASRDDGETGGSDLESIARRMGDADADRLGLREAVEKALGKAGERVIYIRDYQGLPEHLRRSVERRLEQRGGKGRPSALYDPRTQRVYVYTSVNNTPAKALRNAAHEIAGHHGLRTLLGDRLDHALNIALQNPTVKAVADAIAEQRKLRGDQRLLAAEEALAELAAVTRTGDYDLIRRAYGVEVPAGMRASVKRAVDNFLRRLKAMVDDIFGRHVFSDEDVRDLLEAAWQAAQGGPTLSVIGDDGRMTFDQVVFHGTPHNVDRFSLQKIGTGEGAQAYGWGLYFAGRREVANHYRRVLSERGAPVVVGGKEYPSIFHALDDGRFTDDEQAAISEANDVDAFSTGDAKSALEWFASRNPEFAEAARSAAAKVEPAPRGNLYRVEIPEDSDLLDWDKPLSEQSEKVLQALSNETGVPVERYRKSSRTGKQVYRTFISRRGSPEEASRRLAEIGIPGLRYLDGGSRGAGDGTHNYVIWDEAAIGEPDALESVDPNSPSITDRAAGGDSRRSANVDEVTGLPMNDDGTVTVYHHTSADRAESIRRDGLLRADAEPDVYVTTRAETDTGYGDTAVPIRVDPARLELDDEFPNGRRDFRINVGRPGGSIRVRVENDQDFQTQTPEFRRWFGDSKVVDAQGRPLVVYRALTGEVRDGFDGGSFFAYDRGVAEAYADDGGHNVGEFYLSLQNPLILSTPEAVARAWDESGGRDAPRFHGGEDSAQKRLRDWAEAQGYDGIMVTPEAFEGEDGYREAGGTFGEPQIITFRPAQIRSATANSGALDRADPSITREQSGARRVFEDDRQINTPAFRRWFGDSKVVDENGEPLVVYHGSPDARFMDADATFMSMNDRYGKRQGVGAFWFARDRNTASSYADERRAFDYQNAEARVIPAYLKLENPLIIDGRGRQWREAQAIGKTTDVIKQAKAEGRDGVIIRNVRDNYNNTPRTRPTDTYVVFDSRQIKSATGNRGTFDPNSPSILESVDLTPEQQDFMRKAGLAPDTRTARQKMLDWARGVLPDIQKDSLIAGTLDAYYGLKQAVQRKGGATVETDPYIAARMINIASTMEAILRFGAPKMEGGALRVNRDVPGLFDALKPVQDNLPGFFGWMVARRAKLLKEQGREQLMSDADIQAGLSLRNGHEAAFDEAARNYLRLKNAILDFAEQHGGTIDPAARAAWDHAEYIPFYREDGEGGVAGPGTKRGLTHQSAGIRRLKGGEQNLRDPLANIIQNFTRLMDSALKNRAMQLAVDQLGDTYFKKVPPKMAPGIIPLDQVKKHLLAQGVDQATIDAMPQAALKGVAKMLTIEAPTGDNVVRVMREGKPEYYEVEDPLLLRALTAFNENPTPAWMKPLVWAKNLLTAGATSTLDFLIRSAIRDTGEAAVTAREHFIPIIDTAKGAIESAMMDDFAQDLMMAGSYFHGGLFEQGQYEATSRAIKRALRRHGMGEGKAERFVKTLANPKRMWDLYRAGIEATEMGSRVSLARNRMKATGSFLEGAFEAKDFLDFTLKGDAALMQFFTRVIPFLNARLQGAYRLARAGTAKDRRRRVLARMAVMALASTALYAWNMLMHRDAYDDLEEWDKDAYWHFAPGTDYHIRLPKPFELGLLAGTAVERATAALVHAVTGGEAGDRSDQTLAALLHGITDTLAINPIPQAFKPAAEVYFNYNTFSDRPIESRGDEFLPPSERKTPHTSDFAAWVSGVLEGAVGEENALSPKQLQHLWRGYTGGMGMYLLNAADVGTRWLEGAPPKPESRLRDMPGIGALYRSGQHHTSRWVDEFYDLREVAQTQSNKVKAAMETGEPGRARNLEAEYGWLLGSREESKRAKGGFMHSGVRAIERAGREMAQLRKADRQIYESREMSPAEKRRRLDENARRRNEIAREMVRKLRARERERGR